MCQPLAPLPHPTLDCVSISIALLFGVLKFPSLFILEKKVKKDTTDTLNAVVVTHRDRYTNSMVQVLYHRYTYMQ